MNESLIWKGSELDEQIQNNLPKEYDVIQGGFVNCLTSSDDALTIEVIREISNRK